MENKIRVTTLPFSESLIRDNKLHIVKSDQLLGSTILAVLEKEFPAETPSEMVVCFDGNNPVALGLTFKMSFNPFSEKVGITDPKRIVGFINVYVKKFYRGRGIGTQLASMAIKSFLDEFPQTKEIVSGRYLKVQLPKVPGVKLIQANVKDCNPTYREQIERKYLIVESQSRESVRLRLA